MPALQSQPVDPGLLPVRADRELKRIPLPNGAFRREHYDFAGRMHVAEEPGGRQLFCKYDADGRLTRVQDGAATLTTFIHGEKGSLHARTAETETIIRTDEQQRPSELITRIGAREWRIDFEWSKEGAPAGLLYPQAQDWLQFARSGSNFEVQCGAQLYLRCESRRDVLTSKIRFCTGASIREEVGAGRRPAIQRIAHFGSDGESVFDLRYECDDQGRIVGAGAERFTYDESGRLAAAAQRIYTYDPQARMVEAGPETLFSYAQGPMVAAAKTGERETVYEYDGAGRRTSKENHDGVTGYEYDALGQLRSVSLPGGEVIRYLYDGFGRLVARHSSAGWMYFISDLQGHRLAEADESGRIIRSYLWLGAQCVACVQGPPGQPIARTFHRAHAGRVAAIGDSEGRLVQLHAKDPFGGDSLIAEGFPGYASLFGDPATGLLYAGTRWLDPGIAQFLTADAWFGRDPSRLLPPELRRYARATPGGPGRKMTAAQAYNWCSHDPINHTDPNGHSWYGLIFTTISALIWALQLTTVSIELEMFNIVMELLQWFPLFRPAWGPHSPPPGQPSGWDKFFYSSIFNLSPPVASSRLNVPFAFVLNGLLTNGGGRVWTMGNVIWASGTDLRSLDKTAKRDLLVCGNGSSYTAATAEAATIAYGARSPFTTVTATADAAGTNLNGVAITAPPTGTAATMFDIDDWIAVRKTGDATDELRQISSPASMTLANPLPASFFGQAVEIKRVDYGIVKIEKGDNVIARKVTFIRGNTIHYAQQIPQGFPVDGLTVTEYMPSGEPKTVFARSNTEFLVVRLSAAADQALYVANDFVRVRSGSTYFARVIDRTSRSRDLVLKEKLPAPSPPTPHVAIEIAKLSAAEPAVPNQTANGDHVNVGNVLTLRKLDGLTIDNAAGATERRIVLSLLMDCQVVALPGNLQGAPVKVEQMNADASRQAQGKNTSATVITTMAGQASRFSNDDWVRVAKVAAPVPPFATQVTAVDNAANTITLRDALDAASFPANTDVTVTLLAAGRAFDAENVAGPGDHIRIKSDNPGDLGQNDIIRVKLQSDSNVAAIRVITAPPVVVAVVDSALPASHTATLSVRRFAPVANTVRSNASAPQVQLRFTSTGAPPGYANGDLLFIDGRSEQNWGKVLNVTGQDIFLTDPIDFLLPNRVRIVAITATGVNSNGGNLDESRVLVPSAVFTTAADDPDLAPITHRESTTNHEMRHVFQYALMGPFFHSLPLPWLINLGFSFSDSAAPASDILRHFSLGAVDSAIAGIVWGIAKEGNRLPSEADVTATLGADLKTITFAVADAAKLDAFSTGSPVTVKKTSFETNNAVDHVDTGARTVTLRVPVPSDKFAANDAVEITVSAFEKIRKQISTYLGLNIDQLWSDHIPTAWGQVLSKFLNRDSWFPGLGFYWLTFYFGGGDQRRVPLEQDAAFHSGDLYSSIVVSNPRQIYQGQFSRIYSFLQPRTGGALGDVADTLSKQLDPLELLQVELPGGVTVDQIAGAVPASMAGRIRFRENWYLPMSEKTENVVGALFAAQKPDNYILHGPFELRPDEKVPFAPDFFKTKTITVTALTVLPNTDAAHPLFETEEVLFQITGDNTAEYRLRYKGPPAPPAAPAGTIAGLRFTAPVLPGPGNVTHNLEVTATYAEAHPVFHGPAQLPVKLTPDQRTNLAKDDLAVNISPIPVPAIPNVQAGRKADFDTPIAVRSVRITSPLPAGAVVQARVVLGAGRPAHNTFFAPNLVTAAADVTFELTFGTAPVSKTVNVTVHVTP